MPAPGYTVKTAGATALAAATAKTVINIIAGANDSPTIVEFGVSFDGVTATNVPVLVELCQSTQGAAGTPGSSPTPTQIRGWPAQAANCTAGESYTAEPTTLTQIKQWLVPPTGGLVIQSPLGREAQGVVAAATAGKGMCLRITAPAIVNVRAYVEYEE